MRHSWRGTRPRGPGDGAFTLIELLVVIVVIGILAAIAMPVLVRQREKGWDVVVASDLRNAAIAQDAYLTDGTDPGHYATTVAELVALGFRPSSGSHYQGGTFAMTVGGAGGDYCLTAQSRSGTFHGYSSDRGAFTRSAPIDPDTCA